MQESMNHFWQGLKTGKFVEKSEEEIKDFIAQNHFGREAIQELSPEDKETIMKPIFRYLKYRMNASELKKLCEEEIVYSPKAEHYGGRDIPHFILNTNRKFNPEKLKYGLLSKEEKIKLFSNPDIWNNAKLVDQFSIGPLLSWGMRYLEGYGFEKEEFDGMVKRIKNNTHKDLVNILDVGGAMGVALNEAKQNYPNEIITHNLTVDVEPVIYDVDNLYLATGERFPIELKENMDLILSNMAFVYMPGQSLALENCIQSLSVGGEAHLSVGWGKQDNFIKNSPQKMQAQYKRMQELDKEGFIELDVNSGDYNGDHALTYNPIRKDKNYFPSAFVKIKKLKSLEY